MLLVRQDYVDDGFPKNKGAASNGLVFVSCEFRKLHPNASQGHQPRDSASRQGSIVRLPLGEISYGSQYLGCQLQCGLIESKQFDEYDSYYLDSLRGLRQPTYQFLQELLRLR